ncbi:hypothetical protein H1P_230029 [Hyella patelloides LEGE 07179]|uniref:Uncharacterized protein n=1 Tax=Hyella patelloides LEGE 07179 TaxID=945734 RepID=A0A563VRH0_9CYAN|nr:hypothetical protein [Hyella patelloides]VEP13965.1 hypothetical protein H1P_230029 [Hyella patelloides LEGE 07179]
MKPIITNITKLTLAVATTFLVNEIAVSQAASATEEVSLDSLCSKFPQNSRCRDYNYSSGEPEQTTLEIERSSLCTKFPQNSYCLEEPLQVLRMRLERSGENDEWIRMEKQDNNIKILHTTRVKNNLVSGMLNGALNFVPVPLPFVELNDYNWKDHQVTEVSFQPDDCQADSCTVTGVDSLTLPEGTDIYSGLLTVKYQEGELGRSVTFRVPTDVETETSTSITIPN